MEKSCIKQAFLQLYALTVLAFFFSWSYLQQAVYKSTIKPISWPRPCVMVENIPSRMWIPHVWTENSCDLGTEVLTHTHTPCPSMCKSSLNSKCYMVSTGYSVSKLHLTQFDGFKVDSLQILTNEKCPSHDII